MTGHGAKFDRKKEEAIAALLTHRNIEEAANAVRISGKTLLRWMKEPEFDPRTERPVVQHSGSPSHGSSREQRRRQRPC
jgi:hypothetical protein